MDASESLSCENNNSSLFSAVPDSSNMYQNKDSNLIKDAIILCYTYNLENMARSLNSRCNFDNWFFTCNLPEDVVLLVVKVKTKTGNPYTSRGHRKAD